MPDPALEVFDAIIIRDDQALLVGADVAAREPSHLLAGEFVGVHDRFQSQLVEVGHFHIQQRKVAVSANQTFGVVARFRAIEARPESWRGRRSGRWCRLRRSGSKL